MRTVFFTIPSEYPAKTIRGKGYFHHWGVCTTNNSDGNEINTVAIVESETGEVFEVYPVNLKFTDKP